MFFFRYLNSSVMPTINIEQDKLKREITIGTGKANIYALFLVVPSLIVFYIPFRLIWKSSFPEITKSTVPDDMVTIIGVLVIGIVLHELIHGMTWAYFCKKGFKSIKFGIVWKALTPYCHCKEILKMKHYKAGAFMPGIILGLIPSIIGIISGNLGILYFGLIFTFAAGGDFIIVWMLRKEAYDSQVQDHPEKIGCIIYDIK